MITISEHIHQKMIQIGSTQIDVALHGAEAYGYMQGMREGIHRAVVAMMPKDAETRNAALEQLKRDTIEIADIINECIQKASQ